MLICKAKDDNLGNKPDRDFKWRQKRTENKERLKEESRRVE